ncbi:MAG: class I SAM-dependent methyltransferase [Agriterribacter sp.]
MNTKEAYNIWAAQYDSNQNKTRDMEGATLHSTLTVFNFNYVLEIGCGTGKNTVWLSEKTKHITAIDLSDEMLAVAKAKVSPEKVIFKQADITQPWNFATSMYDLVTFSLVLEHIEHLDPIFVKVASVLNSGGICYVGELHPFKQYTGTKARFDTEEGRQIVDCYNHNISDFVKAAEKAGLTLIHLNEHFDDGDTTTIPRILTLIFQYKQ